MRLPTRSLARIRRLTGSRAYLSASAKKPSLFGCESLQVSSDFPRLTKRTNDRIDELVSKLENIALQKLHLTHPEKALYLLDSISNELCSVVDVSELCRNVHDNEEFRMAAEQTFADLMVSIHTLNARTSIYKIIEDIYTYKDTFQRLSDEEKMFVRDMKAEYESEGITLPQELKQKLLDLQNEIVSLETAFLNNCNSDNSLFELGPIAPHTLPHLRHWIEQFVPQRQFEDSKSLQHTIVCTSSKRVSLALLKSLQSETTRASLWYQIWFEPSKNLSLLGALVQRRQALSALLQKPSFTHKYLEKQAVKTPEEVRGYLELLSAKTRPQAEKELAQLTDLQRRMTGRADATLQPWDISFYTSAHAAMNKEFKKESATGQDKVSSERYEQETLSQYLSLSHCIRGLVALSRELFDIEFVQCALEGPENWASSSSGASAASGFLSALRRFGGSGAGSNSDIWTDALRTGIFKFDVWDNKSKEKIGTIFLDMYGRHDKFPGSALFTLQGGCRVSIHKLYGSHSLKGFEDLQLNTVPFQPSHVALVMTLNVPVKHASVSAQSDSSLTLGPLLTLHEVETLHHEWGHLLHSLLSRTAFQHLSGTRTAMDFSEVSQYPASRIHTYRLPLTTASVIMLKGNFHLSKYKSSSDIYVTNRYPRTCLSTLLAVPR